MADMDDVKFYKIPGTYTGQEITDPEEVAKIELEFSGGLSVEELVQELKQDESVERNG